MPDTACNYTMHGKAWREEFSRALVKDGQPPPIEVPGKPVKCSGIGETTGGSTWTFPTGIYGNNGQVSSLEVDSDIPMLWSYKLQGALDIHHHTKRGTIDIDALGIK